jgi:SAM-dependent methyltransferase
MDLEQLDEAEWQAHFDYIIMGDILEHLRDPWQVIVNLKQMLKAGGEILASIPNVGHISTIYALLHGKWQYEEAGILDRTHLRFFTKQSVRDIMENAGLKVVYLGHSEEAIAAPENALKKELLALQNATVSEEELDAYQWEVVARK